LPGVNWFREALPVELHIVSGSVVLGSDSTPSVLVANFERTEGTLEITDVSCFFSVVTLLISSLVLLATNTSFWSI
jgi:hypothetical protein